MPDPLGVPGASPSRVAPAGAVVLAVDAATPAASVAVLRGGVVLAAADAAMRPGADDALMPAVDAALRAAGVAPRALAAVVCGAGPGGFTSLRIAAAVAKGLAHATGCALVAVPSLALAAAARAEAGEPGGRHWLVTLDALRGERYAAEVDTVRDAAGVRVTGYRYLGVRAAIGAGAPVASGVDRVPVDANATPPLASAVRAFALRLGDAADGGSGGPTADGAAPALAVGPVPLDAWEPDYGRLAEAQARWETMHGRALATALVPPPA